MPTREPSPESMLETHEFAAKALEEVAKRAAADGHDPGILHTAFCIAAVSYLANAYGRERAHGLLEQLAAALEGADEPTGR